MSTSCSPFAGVGTGRCGTSSLMQIVGACEGCEVTHESYQLSWYDSMQPQLGNLIRDMHAASKRGVIAGEVNQSLMPHLGSLRSSIRDMKVICLHRDKQDTVDSFVNFGSHMIRPEDKKGWVGCSQDFRTARAMKGFPLIDADTPRQAYEFYWEMYEARMKKIPGPVFHVQTEDLNDDDCVRGIFDFLEIEESNRVVIDKKKFFTIDEVSEHRRRLSLGRS